MDTSEARYRLCELAQSAIELLAYVEAGRTPAMDRRQQLRDFVLQARELLPDAGYPGEGVWHGLQRASLALDTYFDEAEPGYWMSVKEELATAVETLEALLSPLQRRDADFHIVG